ncbi:hypothetical protein L195_g038535, partial [Trifolium pratense]
AVDSGGALSNAALRITLVQFGTAVFVGFMYFGGRYSSVFHGLDFYIVVILRVIGFVFTYLAFVGSAVGGGAVDSLGWWLVLATVGGVDMG